MREYFKFKGVSSEFYTLWLQDEWTDNTPEIAYEETDIEGKDGAILRPLNFRNVPKTVNCVLAKKELHDLVKNWITGQGEFVYNGRVRQASVFAPVEFSKIGPFKELVSIPFIFEPFWYKETDEYERYTSFVDNDGNYDAVPMIKMVGSGNGTVTINGLSFGVMFDSDGQIIMDCKEKTEDKPLCVNIGFRYPVLSPGRNEIAVSGDVAVYIRRKDRWIG